MITEPSVVYRQITERVRAALSHLDGKDAELPAPVADAQRRLAAAMAWMHAPAAANALDAARAVITDGADPAEVLGDLAAARADAEDRTVFLARQGVPAALQQVALDVVNDALPGIVARLDKPARAAAERLTETAHKLPAELDAESLVAANASEAWLSAVADAAALRDFAHLATYRLAPPADVDVTKAGHRVAIGGGFLALLDVPDTEPNRHGRLGPTTTEAVRRVNAAIRGALETYGRNAEAAQTSALVRIARGHHPGVRLTWSSDPGELRRRWTAIANAHRSVPDPQ